MADRITQDIPVSAQPTGGQAFALTPAGKIPPALLSATLTYRAYTPTWASSGTAPAIGDATVTARYAQLGKVVHCWGSIVFGASSTYGTGSYTFALPTTAVASLGATNIPLGTVYALDSSTSKFIHATALPPSTATFNVQYPATYPFDVQAVFAQTVPWTWAAGDSIAWNITYEAA